MNPRRRRNALGPEGIQQLRNQFGGLTHEEPFLQEEPLLGPTTSQGMINEMNTSDISRISGSGFNQGPTTTRSDVSRISGSGFNQGPTTTRSGNPRPEPYLREEEWLPVQELLGPTNSTDMAEIHRENELQNEQNIPQENTGLNNADFERDVQGFNGENPWRRADPLDQFAEIRNEKLTNFKELNDNLDKAVGIAGDAHKIISKDRTYPFLKDEKGQHLYRFNADGSIGGPVQNDIMGDTTFNYLGQYTKYVSQGINYFFHENGGVRPVSNEIHNTWLQEHPKILDKLKHGQDPYYLTPTELERVRAGHKEVLDPKTQLQGTNTELLGPNAQLLGTNTELLGPNAQLQKIPTNTELLGPKTSLQRSNKITTVPNLPTKQLPKFKSITDNGLGPKQSNQGPSGPICSYGPQGTLVVPGVDDTIPVKGPIKGTLGWADPVPLVYSRDPSALLTDDSLSDPVSGPRCWKLGSDLGSFLSLFCHYISENKNATLEDGFNYISLEHQDIAYLVPFIRTYLKDLQLDLVRPININEDVAGLESIYNGHGIGPDKVYLKEYHLADLTVIKNFAIRDETGSVLEYVGSRGYIASPYGYWSSQDSLKDLRPSDILDTFYFMRLCETQTNGLLTLAVDLKLCSRIKGSLDRMRPDERENALTSLKYYETMSYLSASLKVNEKQRPNPFSDRIQIDDDIFSALSASTNPLDRQQFFNGLDTGLNRTEDIVNTSIYQDTSSIYKQLMVTDF